MKVSDVIQMFDRGIKPAMVLKRSISINTYKGMIAVITGYTSASKGDISSDLCSLTLDFSVAKDYNQSVIDASLTIPDQVSCVFFVTDDIPGDVKTYGPVIQYLLYVSQATAGGVKMTYLEWLEQQYNLANDIDHA